MGKSYRHTNIIGIAANANTSEKRDKRTANRCLRRIVKVAIQTGKDDIFPIMREMSDEWAFRKDGRYYFGNYEWFMERHMSRTYNIHDEEYWSKVWRKMKSK
jgi:hypothetical protein